MFHPGGRYLLSVSDDKILRCWDLAQEGRRVKTLSGVHDHFVTSLRRAPSLTKGPAAVNGDGDRNGPYGMSRPRTQLLTMRGFAASLRREVSLESEDLCELADLSPELGN